MGELIHSPVYTHEQVTTGLLVLAAHGGNSTTAADELKDRHGLSISEQSLRRWRETQYPQLYRELHDTHRKEIEAALIPIHRDLAIRAGLAALNAVDATTTALTNGNIKDPAGAARNLTVTSATAMDKVYLATDRPTEVRRDQAPNDVLERLQNLFHSIPGTATDEPTPALLGEGDEENAQAAV